MSCCCCFFVSHTETDRKSSNSYIWMTKSLGEGVSTPWLGCSCILAHKGEKSTSYPWVSTPHIPTGYAEVAGSTYSGMARVWTRLRAKTRWRKDKQFFSLTFTRHVMEQRPARKQQLILHVVLFLPSRWTVNFNNNQYEQSDLCYWSVMMSIYYKSVCTLLVEAL